MKNVFVFAVVLLILVAPVLAAEVTLTPVETYESVEAEFNMQIDNYLGYDVITQVELNSPDLELIDVLDFLGWSSDLSSSQITWYDGTVENNVKNALFVYTAKAGLVNQDEAGTIAGTLTYDDFTTEDFSINVTIKNDNTPPVLNNIFPANNSYARAYNNNQEIRINASDSETGIKEVQYEYSDCTNPATQVNLTCNEGECTGNADFANYGENDTACFTVEITNNAEETTTISGSFGFDNTPPTVTLLSPVNNSYSNNMFRFEVFDNKATQFDCEIEIDTLNDIQEIEAFEGINAFALEANVSEGAHDWKIMCTDAVGLQGEDQDSFIYDITPPMIDLNGPADNSGIKDVMIDIAVSDNYEIDTVDYSRELNSSVWPDGENTLSVIAVDKAGNTAEEVFNFYVDRKAPEISIVSPEDGASFDYHGTFVVQVTDDYDDSIECAVSTSVAEPVTQEVNSGEESTINVMLPLGNFSWYMLCVDDLGNSAQSEQRTATAEDLTGPDIFVDDINYVARGTDLTLEAAVTDISGVKQVTANFEGDLLTLVDQGNDVYQAVISIPADQTPGDYDITVEAMDNNDQINTVVEEMTVVENYEVNVNLPGSVEPNANIAVTGGVTKDDSSEVAGIVTITYPDGAADVELNENSDFSYDFTAPDSDGSYDVIVAYETENLIYRATESFSVVSPAQQTSDSGSGSKGIPFDYQGGYSGIKPEEPAPEPEPEPSGEASASELIEPTEEPVVVEEIPEEEPRVPLATGAATGLFDSLGQPVKWGLIILTLAGLIAGGVYSFRKKKKGSDEIDWGPKFR
ncbi:hypothetical protein GF358_04480 [Candidatus Woesearchaeota archaeon]|nr:hypothetical protein [Candidatus Woesearchaeota archaeon]